jgi:hypothetical protein
MQIFRFCHIHFCHTCSECSADMICFEAQYFNFNKIILQSIALWPFQQSKLVRFQSIIILIILITAIIFHVKTNRYFILLSSTINIHPYYQYYTYLKKYFLRIQYIMYSIKSFEKYTFLCYV